MGLAIALSLMSHSFTPTPANANRFGKRIGEWVCDGAIFMWETHESEWWSFTYHREGVTHGQHVDYNQTLRLFPSKRDAEVAMAHHVWGLNSGNTM